MIDLAAIGASTNAWAILAVIVMVITALAFLMTQLAIWAARRVLPKTAIKIDDRFYQLLERSLFPLLMVGGLLLLIDSAPLPEKVAQVLSRSLALAGLFLLWYLLTKGSLILLRRIEGRYEALRNIGTPVETAVKILLIAVGGMIILDNIGISLTPIVTTLGVGSLAVAIALQDTLGNFFAGLYIKADRPIRVGHYIRLESGQEGHVDRIGWRSTHIRALQNNIIVVPNAKLAQTILTNYDLPEKRMALVIPISVSYDADPQRVEEILLEEAKKAAGEVEGLLRDPTPVVRLIPGFGDFSLNFSLICQVRQFTDQYWVQHELRKRIFKRLGKEKGLQDAMGPIVQFSFPPSGKPVHH